MPQAVDPPRAQRVIGPKNARMAVEVGKPQSCAGTHTIALPVSVALFAPLHASDKALGRLESEVRDLRNRIEKLEGGKAQ